ncbi:MAG: ERF family protein [Pseudomonadales bacterium]|jgi:hypothetical protein|nr:ERF family protein [Pseudomonadales bacterium]
MEAEKQSGGEIVVPSERRQPAPAQVTPHMLIAKAIDRGMDPDTLAKLIELAQQQEREAARKAWVAAMSRFRAACPPVAKSRHVYYTTRSGDVVDYWHSPLSEVADTIGFCMGAEGLSFRWEQEQTEGKITVRCIVSHEDGHSEHSELHASPDQSGGKNAIQAVGSTVTYLQRYTLMGIAGVAASDQDDDGRQQGVEKAEPAAAQPKGGTVTPEQAQALQARCEAAGVPEGRFLLLVARTMKQGVPPESFAEIPASAFKACDHWLSEREGAADSEAS